jgi:hypothetical protein
VAMAIEPGRSARSCWMASANSTAGRALSRSPPAAHPHAARTCSPHSPPGHLSRAATSPGHCGRAHRPPGSISRHAQRH